MDCRRNMYGAVSMKRALCELTGILCGRAAGSLFGIRTIRLGWLGFWGSEAQAVAGISGMGTSVSWLGTWRNAVTRPRFGV